jgi:acyl-CoA reductase-like NAD-dependent aldehyde dehydrogenase
MTAPQQPGVVDPLVIVNENPATGEIIGRVPYTTDVDELVRRAVVAQQTTWATTNIAERIRLLTNGLVALGQRREELAVLISREMGKPLAEAHDEVNSAVEKDEYMELLHESLQPVRHGPSNVVVREPLGVVGIASPWNFPCDEILLLTLPALASGNTVIVKPSELTPLTGALTVETLASVLPPNVLQLVQGDGRVGAHLVAHPHINMIAMTGSSATGQKILEAAAPHMKRLVLEMGGKDPMVVMADADLALAAHDAVAYSLANAGQVCCSFERIYVAEEIYDDFIQRVVTIAQSYRVGNGLDPETKVGPLVSARQRQKVVEQVDDAVAQGARLVYQSDVPIGTNGHYYPVTVLTDVTSHMKVYRDETFGPVISIIRFSGTEQDAIDLANDTEYGLAASVYSRDIEMATRLSSSIRAGQVGVNCYAPMNMESTVPWVGHKAVRLKNYYWYRVGWFVLSMPTTKQGLDLPILLSWICFFSGQSGYGYHSGCEGFNNFSLPKTIVFADATTPPTDV